MKDKSFTRRFMRCIKSRDFGKGMVINMISTHCKKLLDATSIPKYAQSLGCPHIFTPSICVDATSGRSYHQYDITMREFEQQVLPPPYPKTMVYGYGGLCQKSSSSKPTYVQSYPGPTFMVTKGIPVKVTWKNQLVNSHMFPVDPTIPWANTRMLENEYHHGCYPAFPPGVYNTQWPIPTVVHLHGGEVRSDSDGHPNTWYTSVNYTAPQFTSTTYTYPNQQESTMLWYHDHALGVTRLNVYAGLAGAYIIKDPKLLYDRPDNNYLPTNEYEIPLIIQDRTFYEDGSLYYPTVGSAPYIHPYWNEEFMGNCIVVNGRVWPCLAVCSQLYRFKLLNASNSTIMEYAFEDNLPFYQISTDGGYIEHPRKLTSICLAPGERADILFDFGCCEIGKEIRLLNIYNGSNPDTTGQVMQFIICSPGKKSYKIPSILNSITKLQPNTPLLNQVLYQEEDRAGNITKVLINGQSSTSVPSEFTKVGTTVPFALINTTNDTHPMHLHLIQFQIQGRIPFDSCKYRKDWLTLNESFECTQPTKPLPYDSYITGPLEAPAEYEYGWKDTIQSYPDYITIVVARYAPTCYTNEQIKPGVNLFPFDPTIGPGYVWHCHLLEHEDNDMSRLQFIIH